MCVMRSLRSLGRAGLKVAVAAAESVFEVLSEASADVGEWFIRQCGPDAEARFRSRYL
jgi:hypothetical protein